LTFLYQNNFRLFILANKILFSGYISNYLFLLLVNPGIPGKENYQDIFINNYKGNLKLLQRCDECKIVIHKNSKSKHCAYCNICILRYDHHCPWIGKCVGKYNFIIFYLFLILLLLFILNGLIIFILYLKNFKNI
jgi:hypothetical protein